MSTCTAIWIALACFFGGIVIGAWQYVIIRKIEKATFGPYTPPVKACKQKRVHCRKRARR